MTLPELLSLNGGLEVPGSKITPALPLGSATMTDTSSGEHGVFDQWRPGQSGQRPSSKLPFAITTVRQPKPPRRKATQLAASIFLPVKSAGGQPIKPLLQGEPALDGHKGRREKLAWFGVWLVVAVLALLCVASGFRIQQVQHNREKLRLARQLKATEQSRKQVELAARQEHANFVLYIAQQQQQQKQPDLRWVANSRPRPRFTTKS